MGDLTKIKWLQQGTARALRLRVRGKWPSLDEGLEAAADYIRLRKDEEPEWYPVGVKALKPKGRGWFWIEIAFQRKKR